MAKKVVEFLKRIDWQNISVATYVRYILMVVTIVNTILTRIGHNPIPVSEDALYQAVSDILSIGILLANTWYNNSVTKEAIAADACKEQLVNTNKK